MAYRRQVVVFSKSLPATVSGLEWRPMVLVIVGLAGTVSSYQLRFRFPGVVCMA